MKRYFLFIYNRDFVMGGWNDFRAHSDDINSLILEICKLDLKQTMTSKCHIIDSANGQYVLNCNCSEVYGIGGDKNG